MSSSSSSSSDDEEPKHKIRPPPVVQDGTPEPEIEVQSHAARRKQQKKMRLAAKQLEAQESSPPKSTKVEGVDNDGTAKPPPKKRRKVESKDGPEPVKRQNSIWVGNLSYKTTEEDLKTFFAEAGEVTRLHMPMKPGRPGTNSGFAYVDFSTPESKVKAIEMSERHLCGRKLLIKDGGDFTGRPEPVPASAGEAVGPCLFVGNLGFDTTELSLTKYIAEVTSPLEDEDEAKVTAETVKQHGRRIGIRAVRLATFEDTGKCKGFGFIDFKTIEEATTALKAVHKAKKTEKLHGREISIQYASLDAVRRGGGAGGPRAKLKEQQAAQRRETGGEFGKERGEERHTRPKMEKRHVQFGGEAASEEEHEPESKPRRPKGQAPSRRAKPGAALALAHREKVAIVPSTGQRMTFT